MDYDFESLYLENRGAWEPETPFEWLNRDPLRRALEAVQMAGSVSETEAVSFHAAFIRYPAELRAQLFREREIAGHLIRRLPVWRNQLPNLLSVGVGKRLDPEPRLCAVMTLESPLPTAERHRIREQWAANNVANSAVPEYQEPVPVYFEVREPPTFLGQVPAGGFLFSDPDPAPASAPVLQSGDRIGSESPAGIREFGTLSCLVSDPGSTDPLALSSGHVFLKPNYRVVSTRGGTAHVGHVRSVNMDCDAAVAELQTPYLCDYRLRVSDLVPAAPVIATNDLAVQLHGAISGTQAGYLNQVNVIPANARAVGLLPVFTADIKCVRGDSGALLVTGIGKDPPALAWQKKYMAPAYLDSMTSAILAILMAGVQAGADPMLRPQAYFSPAVQIFNDLGVEAWVR